MHVVILKKARLGAAATGSTHERALISVALMDGTPHVGGDVTRVFGAALRPGLLPWVRRGRMAPLLDAFDERIQCAVEHLGDIA
jgi:hypothetical protein